MGKEGGRRTGVRLTGRRIATNGDVWIDEREEYRIVVYSSDGRFLRTIQMRNLVCAIKFDMQNPRIAPGQDVGRVTKIVAPKRANSRKEIVRRGRRAVIAERALAGRRS